MRPLRDLIDAADPAWPRVQDWIRAATNAVEVLPPSDQRDDVLLQTQVTTRSPMGAIVHETGGLLIDHGFLRILGSGNDRLPRTLPGWNAQIFSAAAGHPHYLVADDIIGGFYALNGGHLGRNPGNVYYFSPDTFRWEDLGRGYSEFIRFALAADLEAHYASLRWPDWKADAATLAGDRSLQFYPLPCTREARDLTGSSKSIVPTRELYHLYVDTLAPQLGRLDDGDQFKIRFT